MRAARIERGQVSDEIDRRPPLAERELFDSCKERFIRQSSGGGEHVFVHVRI
jgi:hypothetical protein